MKATWSVAVIFEDAKSQERAITFCDSLVRKFWADFEFDVGWWSFEGLKHPDASKEALDKSLAANLVVFAVRSQRELPAHIHQWTSDWLHRRGNLEGTLVGLFDSAEDSNVEPACVQAFLRHCAHAAGMDFLTEIPQDLARPVPETLESCSERAHQVTGVLNAILHQPNSVPRLPG
ncbi:MAG TPA: hypothetical protein VFP96_12640 [Candidatus Acidoferrum sp.]|nr:hypothetical protein [Candidatus Acidoferrum sp.]